VLNRGNAGAGALVGGYKHQLTSHDSLESSVVLSSRPVVSATSTRRLGTYTTASLGSTYSREAGLGLAVSSSRQLSGGQSAMLTWTVGPLQASALSLVYVRRGQRLSLTLKLDLGVVTAVGVKLGVAVNETTHLRASGEAAAAAAGARRPALTWMPCGGGIARPGCWRLRAMLRVPPAARLVDRASTSRRPVVPSSLQGACTCWVGTWSLGSAGACRPSRWPTWAQRWARRACS
jgi:hypothetical protein